MSKDVPELSKDNGSISSLGDSKSQPPSTEDPRSTNTNSIPHLHPYREIATELLWVNRTVVAASSAAVVGVAAGFPFDSIKTRMQTHHYDSMMQCVKSTYHEEGMRGYFRGIIPPLITVSIIKSVSFSVYEGTKRSLRERFQFFNQDSLLSVAAVSTLGGATSGSFIATFSCPLELVKIQQQLQHLLLTSSMATGGTIVRGSNGANGQKVGIQRTDLAHKVGAGLPITTQATRSSSSPLGPPKLPNVTFPPATAEKLANSVYGKVTPIVEDIPKQTTRPANGASTSSWRSAREIVRLKGVKGLWSGYPLHLVRDTIGTAVYFGTYESTKRILSTPSSPPGPLTHFMAGGTCGILCWIVVFPIDLIKSVMQKDIMAPKPTYDTIRECVSDIKARQGYRGFYRGMSVTLMRAFPIHSLNFLVYEQVLQFARKTSGH
ncbi:hypothetical protein INT44_007454 [Umbelopsis vinacea]|uniref:Mitochondrial carrier n=1 Tax=Umbelopsis vinacea TaxID=44442 RepID=A0A8H7PN90_9FUNG|nr:hypothetical protein INT44_007454 [Umbelopsis vinacea]